jgi:ubiquinone/menaquinone biosynthesis C-methylase UbiE
VLDYAARYDRLVGKPIFREIFGDEGFFNVGLWDGDPDAVESGHDARAAAARLAHEILSRLAPATGSLLEAAAGSGAAARLGRMLRPGIAWTGLDLSLGRLARAGPALLPVVADATSLPFRDDLFDAVLSIEAAFHFPSRERFLREARRVVRPGGQLVMTDLVAGDGLGMDDWLFPAANRLASRSDLERLLAGCGWSEIAIEDWTDRAWRPFVRLLQARDARLLAAGELAAADFRIAEERRRRQLESKALVGYFAIVARRPLS